MAGKADIVDHVAGTVEGLTKKQVAEVFDAIFECIGNSLAAKDRVQIAGFGSFFTSERKARKGLNPATREVIDIPASTAVRFKPGKELKEKVN
ncbi:MAG: HU family DNA-binding protein [Acidobacteria bacterium]|nr:MAG: HU family DNA-binding protein [Acidobacteriota bacterium]